MELDRKRIKETVSFLFAMAVRWKGRNGKCLHLFTFLNMVSLVRVTINRSLATEGKLVL